MLIWGEAQAALNRGERVRREIWSPQAYVEIRGGELFRVKAIKAGEGKRLMYRDPIGK